MKIASFLRGVATVLVADVDKVFVTAEAAVEAAPILPQNIKDDLAKTVRDSKADFDGVVSLGGTLAGHAAADAVDDLTTLLMNTAGAISTSGGDLSKLSAAEKTVLLQTWTAMKAQGDTLVAQLHAGLDPTATATSSTAPTSAVARAAEETPTAALAAEAQAEEPAS